MTIEPPIGTCSHKQNFPCDDQVRIDDIVIESKNSGLNLKKKKCIKDLEVQSFALSQIRKAHARK